MKRTIFTLLLCVLFAGGMFAQSQDHQQTIHKLGTGAFTTAPVVDGAIDDVWATVEKNNIDLPFYKDGGTNKENPTLGDPGETYWKALYDDNGMYIIVVVTDDIFSPCYTGCNNYEYDKIELYFNSNGKNLLDGLGATAPGHYQIAPGFTDGKLAGESQTSGDVTYATLVDGTNWTFEYFVPFSHLLDANASDPTLSDPMGFDVTAIDNDTPGSAIRNRAVWSNDGTMGGLNESWSNMDQCGTIHFEGAVVLPDATGVAIDNTELAIAADNDTLRMMATVTPAEAKQKVAWTVTNGTGRAKIDADGLLTGVMNGTVTVTATTTDGTYLTATKEVTVSNQFVDMNDINMIKDGLFNTMDPDGTVSDKYWSSGAMVVDGVAEIPAPGGDGHNFWDYVMNQTIYPEPNTAYTISFVLWSDEADTVDVDNEDVANNYPRCGKSSSPLCLDPAGTSDWAFVCNTEPTKYTVDVHDYDLLDNSNIKFQFMIGKATGTVYVDSVYMVSNDDLAMVNTEKIETITISAAGGATSLPNHTTLQMSAEVGPSTSLVKNVIWSIVPGTGDATISKTGLVTGVATGSVMVKAEGGDHQGAVATYNLDVAVGIHDVAKANFNVYPNPAVNELNVDLSTPNSTIAIYNSIGQKVAQMVATGSKAKFDIRSLSQGVYYVKVNNGAAVKFVK